MTVDFLAQDTVGFAPLAVQFTAQVDKPAGANVVLTWDFGDGSASLETSATTVSHTYPAVGLYSVSVSVSAAGQIAQKTIANCVEVASRYIYVDNSSENEVAPYATPQTAAKTIDAALAAISTAGQTIRVMPGNYVQPYPAVLDKAVTVMGMGESPTNVVVEQTAPIAYNDDQNKVTRNIFTLNHADAIVCNLTMKKGWHRMVNATPSAGGVVVQSNGGTVSNCVITGCVSARNNHGAAGADLVAGLITHTLIEDCEVDNPNLPYTPRHGGASAIRLTGNGRAENCLVRNCNRGAASDQFHAVLLNGADARAGQSHDSLMRFEVLLLPGLGRRDDAFLRPLCGVWPGGQLHCCRRVRVGRTCGEPRLGRRVGELRQLRHGHRGGDQRHVRDDLDGRLQKLCDG